MWGQVLEEVLVVKGHNADKYFIGFFITSIFALSNQKGCGGESKDLCKFFVSFSCKSLFLDLCSCNDGILEGFLNVVNGTFGLLLDANVPSILLNCLGNCELKFQVHGVWDEVSVILCFL